MLPGRLPGSRCQGKQRPPLRHIPAEPECYTEDAMRQIPRQDKYRRSHNPCPKDEPLVESPRREEAVRTAGARPVGILVFTVSLLVKLNIKENKLI